MAVRRAWPAALAVVWFFAGCAQNPTVREIPPHESLVTLAADFYRFARTDLYRFDVPRDASGQNVFRATLERLTYYESANPGRDRDIADFIRGEAYERLGDFDNAIESFARVSRDPASELSARAAERLAAVRRLGEAALPSSHAGNLSAYLSDLERRAARLAALEKNLADDSFDAMLARRERERVETEYALALFRNRYVVERGAARAVDAAGAMIEAHQASCRIQAHRLMLGEFYFELARDMPRLSPPDRLGFDAALFLDTVNAARKQFAAVSQADGYGEKAQGAAMLDALEAFARNARRELR